MVSSIYYTSTRLVEQVRVRASLPKVDSLYSDDDILTLATDELYDSILPLVRNIKEEYLIYSHPVALVANQQSYEIPERAVGNGLRDLYFQDSSGNPQEMTRIGIDDKYDVSFKAASSQSIFYYLENDSVVLTQNVGDSPTGTLIMKFMIRVSALVKSERVAQITNINRTTGVITFSSLPSIFSTSVNYDFTKTRSPHSILGIDVTPLAINFVGKTITFNLSDIPASLKNGDRVSLENETDIPQIPTEMHRLLLAKTVERVLEGLKDTEGLQNAQVKTSQVQTGMTDLMNDRVETAPLKIKNRSSFLRKRVGRRS